MFTQLYICECLNVFKRKSKGIISRVSLLREVTRRLKLCGVRLVSRSFTHGVTYDTDGGRRRGTVKNCGKSRRGYICLNQEPMFPSTGETLY